jgi:hypothetical protein
MSEVGEAPQVRGRFSEDGSVEGEEERSDLGGFCWSQTSGEDDGSWCGGKGREIGKGWRGFGVWLNGRGIEVDAGNVGGEGFVEAEIEMEGGVKFDEDAGGNGGGEIEIPRNGCVGGEEVGLLDGLRSAGAAEGFGTVGGEGDEGEGLVVGFDNGWEEFGGGGAGSGEDGNGAVRGLDAAEGEEGGTAFFEEIPEFDVLAVEECGQNWGVSSTGRDADFADTQFR